MLPLTLKMATHVHSNFFHKQVMNQSTCQILFKEMFYKLELSKWEGSWDTTLQKLLHQQERTVSHNVNNDYFRFNCFHLSALTTKIKMEFNKEMCHKIPEIWSWKTTKVNSRVEHFYHLKTVNQVSQTDAHYTEYFKQPLEVK